MNSTVKLRITPFCADEMLLRAEVVEPPMKLVFNRFFFSSPLLHLRMSVRRQKRWWNGYILFYEREDGFESDVVKEMTKSIQDLTLGTSQCMTSSVVILINLLT